MRVHKGCFITMLISLACVIGSAISVDYIGWTTTNATLFAIGVVFTIVGGVFSIVMENF